jgi:hypothetical protein
MSQSILKAAAGVAALAAIAFGASAIAGASGSGSGSGSAALAGRPGGMPGGAPPNGARGGPPPGAPGFGSPVTGATAAKVKAAALARYPGTIERVAALPGGRGYIAHVFRTGGSEVHVLVNTRFEVTGLATPPPGGPGGAPPRPASSS